MEKTLKSFYYWLLSVILTPLLKKELSKPPFPERNERDVEYSFALEQIKKRCSGALLDVGTGNSSWPHLLSMCGIDVTAIDSKDLYWKNRYLFNRHFHVVKFDITISTDYINHPLLNKKFQFITCISTLEHIELPHVAIMAMNHLLLRYGYLLLTFPYNSQNRIKNVYTEEECSIKEKDFHTTIFSSFDIDLIKTRGFRIVARRYYQCWTGKYWGYGKRLPICKKTDGKGNHHLICLLLQKM